MLSEISQSQKDKFHLYKESRVVKFIETGSRMVVSKGWRQRTMGNWCLMGTVLQFGKMKIW